MAWKNAAYAAGDWALASANERTGSVRPRNTENRLPASDSQNGTPAALKADAASLATAAAAASTRAYTSGVQPRRVARPAAVASGLPDSVPAWYTGPAGASRDMISARPPKAAHGRPPPITLPNVTRSPATPSTPYQPDAVTRNPVSTSSMISRAPADWHNDASRALNPGAGGTIPMFAGHASVITHAIDEPRSAKTDEVASRSLYGSTMVSAVAAPVTPGVSGSPNVATPEPAAASSASTCPW